MKFLRSLALLLPLVACETRDASPTQSSPREDVAIGARLRATAPLPQATRVRLRLSTDSAVNSWYDVAYQSGRQVDLGRVRRGTTIILDIRAYSKVGEATVWKWFARSMAVADAATALQIVDADIEVVPAASGISTYDPSGEGVILPAGSRYTLDGSDPRESGNLSRGGSVLVPAGKVMRALLRSVVPGTEDTLDGDTVRIEGTTVDPGTGLHVPRNHGPTNLAIWSVRTQGANVLVKGATDAAYAAAPPDSAVVWVDSGSASIRRWRMRYADLASFAGSVPLDSAALNAGAYRVGAQFLWTGGARKGDTTDRDTRAVRGYAGPVPQTSLAVDAGRTLLTVANFEELVVAPSGWTTAIQVEVDGVWHDVLENASGDPFPGLRAGGGTASYPLGANRLKVFHHAGSDTSVVRVVDIGASGMVSHQGKDYPVIRYGDRRWITRPISTSAEGNFCSDKTVREDCGSAGRLYSWLEATARTEAPGLAGDNPSQGVCPNGWRVPFSSEIVALLGEIGPGWTWATRSTYDMESLMAKARFELKGASRESYSGSLWSYPAMWSSTTGTTASLPSNQDLWYIQAGVATAISRAPDFEQIAMVFCIEED